MCEHKEWEWVRGQRAGISGYDYLIELKTRPRVVCVIKKISQMLAFLIHSSSWFIPLCLGFNRDGCGQQLRMMVVVAAVVIGTEEAVPTEA